MKRVSFCYVQVCMIMEIGEENGENKRVLRYTFYLNSLLLEKKERRIKFVSRFDLSRY